MFVSNLTRRPAADVPYVLDELPPTLADVLAIFQYARSLLLVRDAPLRRKPFTGKFAYCGRARAHSGTERGEAKFWS